MKALKYIIASVAISLMAVACTKHEMGYQPDYESDPNAVIVNASILSTRANSEAEGNAFIAGDSFKIENATSTELGTENSIATYLYSDKGWSLDGDKYLVWEDGENDFYAWFPASASYSAFTLPLDQSKVEGLRSADWLKAKVEGEKKPTDRTLDIRFKHQMSKVLIKIAEYNEPYTGKEVLSASTIELAKNVTLKGLTAKGAVKAYVNGKNIMALVAPGTYTEGDQFFTLTLDNETLKVNVPEGGYEFKSAEAYVFELTVGQPGEDPDPDADPVTITSVTVLPWEDVELEAGIAYPDEGAGNNSGWGLVGTFNSWSNDVAMSEFPKGSGIYMSDPVYMYEGDYFKIRKGGVWSSDGANDRGLYYYNSSLEFGYPKSAIPGGADILVSAEQAGSRVVVYDSNNESIYFLGWGIVGTVEGSAWDKDVPMVMDAKGNWIATDVQMTAEGQFKIRWSADWSYNYGAEVFTFGELCDLVQDGANINTGEGRFDITVYPETAQIRVYYAGEALPMDEQQAKERAALIDLYEKTDGKNWTMQSGWCSSAPVGDWFGVYTNEDGYVYALDLGVWGDNGTRVGLTGDIPASIADLKYLEYIGFNGNYITSIPESIGELTNLYQLFINGNQISELPEAVYTLPNLWLLWAQGNHISTISESIGNLTKLQDLRLWQNYISALPESIGNLKSLKDLIIYYNELTELPSTIGDLDSLINLHVLNNQLTSLPESIGDMEQLGSILAGNNPLESLPASVGNISSLVYLHVENTNISELPASVANLSLLEGLIAYNCQLTEIPSWIGELENLTSLNLSFNSITGEIPSGIGNMGSAVRSGAYTPVSKEINRDVAKLEDVNYAPKPGASNVMVQQGIGTLTKMYSLILSNNQITGTIPEEIMNLTELNELYLQNNQLSGTIEGDLCAYLMNITYHDYSGNPDLIFNVPVSKYEGQWTLTADAYHTWVAQEDGMLYSEVVAETISRDIIIEDMANYVEGLEYGSRYYIFGLSELAPEFPIEAVLYKESDVEFLVLSSAQMSDYQDAGGVSYCTAWLPVMETISADGESSVFPQPILALGSLVFQLNNENEASMLATIYSETEEESVIVIGVDLYPLLDTGEISIFTKEDGSIAKTPIGYEMKCVKNTASTASFSFAPNWNALNSIDHRPIKTR